jgi:hypothetical protein
MNDVAVEGSEANNLKIELNEGWNELTIRFTDTGSLTTLGIRVAGENLRIANQPDQPQ